MNLKKINPNLALGVVGVIVAYFGVIRPIFKKVGIIKSEEEKANEASEDTVKGWSPRYWKEISDSKKAALFLKAKSAEVFAKMIHDAFGVFNDDEEQVIAVFKQLKSQVQLSQIAFYYSLNYQQDLFNDVKSRLSESEFTTIVKIVSKYSKL